jgi:nucleotide-binding universal stress UspA family protein
MSLILAALDFSSVTDSVVHHAAALAEAFSTELVLAHVAAPEPDFVGYEAGPQAVRDKRAHELRDEHRRLHDLAEAARTRGLEARALLLQGPTVATLLAEAKRLPATTIVIGSHGHGALHRMLLGSVSEGVVREAPCPILVVPAARPSAG